MSDTLRLSMLQMTSADTYPPNIAALHDAAARAAGEGAALLALPEVAGLMSRDPAVRSGIGPEASDPFIAAAREAAARHGLWLHAGSTPVAGPDGRSLNRSALVSPDGTIAARYDKIHLFDIRLDGGEPTGESTRFAPGEEAVVADTPWGPVGLAICYDLRFPHLFRAYGAAGARIIFVPSAFTVPTGRAHWEVLLRARAIENGCWIVAPAQAGRHADGRETWGHSLAVTPWGEVAADLGDGAAFRTLDLDLSLVEAARRQIPSLSHDRPFSLLRADAPAIPADAL